MNIPNVLTPAPTVLDWMEQSALGVWVATSPYGYYVMLGFHSVGLAMLVGSMMVVDLRLLGRLQGIDLKVLERLSKFAWYGFVMNALSGVAVFFSEANKMFFSDAFRWKILLVFTGIIALAVMQRTVLRPMAASGGAITTNAKVQAAFSLAVWAAVITVGRMIAYLTEESMLLVSAVSGHH
ncbi:MAG TPA: DUF6644 family protein [Steroidobacter sp.]